MTKLKTKFKTFFHECLNEWKEEYIDDLTKSLEYLFSNDESLIDEFVCSDDEIWKLLSEYFLTNLTDEKQDPLLYIDLSLKEMIDGNLKIRFWRSYEKRKESSYVFLDIGEQLFSDILDAFIIGEEKNIQHVEKFICSFKEFGERLQQHFDKCKKEVIK